MPYSGVGKLKLLTAMPHDVCCNSEKLLEMLDNTYDPPRVPLHDDWLDLETAREQLTEHISRFLTTSAPRNAGDAHNAPPVLGLKVSAGLGKTRTALECIAKHGHEFLKRGHILFYVPKLDLAVEAERAFRELNSDLPSFVLRGRSAINPKTSAPMCARSDVAAHSGVIRPPIPI